MKLNQKIKTKQNIYEKMLILVGLFTFTTNIFTQDPNLFIYLCFGQSNMEAMGTIESQDLIVDSRFKVFQALDCPNLGRFKETWYTAVPPNCQCYTKLSPADYFGKTMVAHLSDSITIGIINVSVGGCDIRLFDKDIYEDYDSTYVEPWFLNKIAAYLGNPYQYLINLALLAQQDGVIKGILLHQGETNTGDTQWPSYVRKIYNDMLTDLSLSANSVPILAGELLSTPGNCCSSMNSIINVLPDSIPTAYVISSSGCPGQDGAHFTSEGYREMGRRYAAQMLSIMGVPVGIEKNPETLDGYILGQNYPNPFNPDTKISYQLSEKSNIELTICDIAGQKVVTLISKIQTPGKYTANWDASALNSGIYIYYLKSDNKLIASKKMVLMR